MLQAIGLTSAPRRGLRAAVNDLTFETRPGHVTALLGAPGSGKTAALRLMLELDPGRGVTYFRGRPMHRIPHPAREVGVLLGDVPGHPVRTARGQLRMLCAAAGVPATRADELLELVGLAGLGGQRIGTLSLGMDRRLALASALLGDPHTLVLDDPAEGLAPREGCWLHGLLQAHAARGGTVLYTTADPKEAARAADHVVTIDGGRLVADQDVGDFSRTRLRPRVAVRTPHAARLAAVVSREARAARRSVEVVTEAGGRLAVYGSTCAEIGDTAFRHGLPVHQLADEVGDAGPTAPRGGMSPAEPAGATDPAGSTGPEGPVDRTDSVDPADLAAPGSGEGPGDPRPVVQASGTEPALPIRRRPARGPLHPLRYELRRLLGVRTTTLIMAAVLVVSVGFSVLLARTGHASLPKVLAAWPSLLPLPPAAVGAGLLGALSFGDEFRYPALASGRGTVPRRLGLLLAKLVVSAGVAVVLALAVVLVSAETLRLVYGHDWIHVPPNSISLGVSWVALTVGCAWAGLLAAGVFRVATAGVAAVLAVPVLVVPLVQKVLTVPGSRPVTGLPGRFRELMWPRWPHETDRWVAVAMGVVAHPVGAALALSLSVLVFAYLLTSLHGRARWRSQSAAGSGQAS
ncbi:ATP-binding cassette domain-containing protein [Streptomyces sp. NBC_01591]|uniref:ATP-binding cassette domain-containing protein n=1 Tax=Streptomyces sp. NBC_01591 TaxID=2975888 RepID=UPI002DDBF10D|nr:ATP-binding cassette domain-containing protein [Streptomyces sp. NBC_01591]WSD71336.1 ATP-binding cassette domain-containing protein [Streptomyces sp. NBC_01591]